MKNRIKTMGSSNKPSGIQKGCARSVRNAMGKAAAAAAGLALLAAPGGLRAQSAMTQLRGQADMAGVERLPSIKIEAVPTDGNQAGEVVLPAGESVKTHLTPQELKQLLMLATYVHQNKSDGTLSEHKRHGLTMTEYRIEVNGSIREDGGLVLESIELKNWHSDNQRDEFVIHSDGMIEDPTSDPDRQGALKEALNVWLNFRIPAK